MNLTPERFDKIRNETSARLNRLASYMPPTRRQLDFQEYLARASLVAQRDPEFRRRLAESLRALSVFTGGNYG